MLPDADGAEDLFKILYRFGTQRLKFVQAWASFPKELRGFVPPTVQEQDDDATEPILDEGAQDLADDSQFPPADSATLESGDVEMGSEHPSPSSRSPSKKPASSAALE
jgi:hypothetical protein